MNRREIIRFGSATLATSILPWRIADPNCVTQQQLIGDISHETIFPGRQTRTTWFHPRGCMVPTEDGPLALLTLQTIGGSDYFGPVHCCWSSDLGTSWSVPTPIKGLGRSPLDSGYSVGVCDVVPEYHAATKSVIAIGHNVYYRGGRLARPQRARWPVYSILNTQENPQSAEWTEPRKLDWEDERGTQIYTCGCSQRVNLENGDILISYSFAPEGRTHRSVATTRYSLEGDRLVHQENGNELVNETKRGLLEPTLARHGGLYWMTIRAEDDRGYVTTSEDGLQWQPVSAWSWQDGTPLTMSTTQQRWLAHSDGLFLVYTRRDDANQNVMRWRAPLYVAQVDVGRKCLIKETEKIVFPLKGDGVDGAERVPRMGNFHTTIVDEKESWVTVGETLPFDDWAGDTLLARVQWNKPNELARR